MSADTQTNSIAEAVYRYFQRVHDDVFRGDPATNPRLEVEVLGAALAVDTPTVILITPWTLNGMAFPPDHDMPAELTVGDQTRPVFTNQVADLGWYASVNLVPDVSQIETQPTARTLAQRLAGPFRASIESARHSEPGPDQQSPDPGRRRLLAPWSQEHNR